jgi:hypothetical protein
MIVKLGGVDRSDLITDDGCTVTATLGGRSNADFQTYDRTRTFEPFVGQDVVVEHGAHRLFGGSIESVGRELWTQTQHLFFQANCIDHHRILDRRSVGQREWTDQPAGGIVSDIANTNLTDELVDISNVQAGPTIEKFIADYPMVAEAVDQVAKLAQMFWYVDPFKRLHLFTAGSRPCPVSFAATCLNAEKIEEISSRDGYANKVVMKFGQYVRAEQTAKFTSAGRLDENGEIAEPMFALNGDRQSFEVTYQVVSEPRVYVAGILKTIGIEGVDENKDWYWSKGSKTIRQDAGDAPLSASQTLYVSYQGQDAVILSAQNNTEIALRASLEGNSGIYETIREAATAVASADASQLVESILAQVDEHSRTIRIDTNTLIEPDCVAIQPGQTINFAVQGYTSGQYLVRQVRWSPSRRFIGEVECSLEAVSGPIVGDAVSFFQGLAQAQGITASPGVIRPPDAPAAPQNVELTVVETATTYTPAATWDLPADNSATASWEVQFREFNDVDLTDPIDEWAPLGSVNDAAAIELVGAPLPKRAASLWPLVRVRAINVDNEPGSWVESVNTLEVGAFVAGAADPAPNVTAVSAAVTYNGEYWTISGYVTWPTDRAKIRRARIRVVGPIGSAEEANKPFDEVDPPASGNTQYSSDGSWKRGAGGVFAVEVEVENVDGVITASPTRSANVTVSAVSNSLQVAGLVVERHPDTRNADGVEIYGVKGSFTQPVSPDCDHVELFIQTISDPADKERGPFTKTDSGGGDNGQVVQFISDLWPLVGTTAFTLRITAYVINREGLQLTPSWVDLQIQPGGGSLELGRANPNSLGSGVIVGPDGKFRTVAGHNDNMVMNFGFEDLVSGSPKDWTLSNGAYVVEDVYAWTGTKRVILLNNNSAASTVLMPVRPGAVLQGDFQAVVTGAPNKPDSTLIVSILMFDKLGDWLGGSGDAFNSLTADEVMAQGATGTIKATATVPLGASYVSLGISCDGVSSMNGGHYAIDNASLREISSVAPSTAVPAALAVNGPFETQADRNGIKQWYLFAAWTAEAETPQRTSMEFEFQYANSSFVPTTAIHSLGKTSIASGGLDCNPQPYGASTQYAVVYGYVVTKDGTKGLVGTWNITIPASPANSLNLGNAVPGSLTDSGVGSGISGSKIVNIPAASVAAGLEFVSDVTATPDANGDLVMTRLTAVVRNTTDNRMYRWDPATSRYKRKTGTDDLYANSVTSPIVVAGAIGTRELSTVELLIGAGGGTPPRFKVQDSGANMIAFIGDDSAGFIGGYFQRLRVAPSFGSSQRLEASASGVALENVPLSIAGSGHHTAINATDGVKVTRSSDSGYIQIASNLFRASNNLGTSTCGIDHTGLSKAISGASFAMKDIGADFRLAMYPYSSVPLEIGVSLSGGQGYVRDTAADSYVAFTGSNAYASFYRYRFGELYSTGTTFVTGVTEYRSTYWIPSNLTGSEDLPGVISKVNALLNALAGAGLLTDLILTYCSNWWPVYNSSGSYVGKTPYSI